MLRRKFSRTTSKLYQAKRSQFAKRQLLELEKRFRIWLIQVKRLVLIGINFEKADDKSAYFRGVEPSYVEACMVPFAWHTHLAKAFRGVEIADFLPEKAELARWNAWFAAFSNNEKIKPILADKSKLEKAYQIYTTGEGPAQALKAIKKGEAPPWE